MKRCRVCKVNKNFTEYANHARDGYQSDCRECNKNKIAELTKLGALFLSNLPVDGSRKDKAIYWGINDKHTVSKFLSKIVYKENDCLEWTASITNWGYGQFSIYNGSMKLAPVKAHRFAFALANGFDALPDGSISSGNDKLVINHICHNRKCVNPNHLEVVTDLENKRYRKPKNAA
jgi:hypothetical protein